MGLDVGESRIGIALSDPLMLTAQGFETYHCRNRAADLAYLKSLMAEKDVSLVVAGLPMNMNNTLGEQALYVQDFMAELEKETNIPVDYWDERLSTMLAERYLVEEADLSRRKRKNVVDKMAAVLILQAYMDSRANQPKG